MRSPSEFFVKLRLIGIQYLGTRPAYKVWQLQRFLRWESLSKLIGAPVFKVALTSVLVTPILASIYVYIEKTFGAFIILDFPDQMALLFFAGIAVIAARVIYEMRLPPLIRERATRAPGVASPLSDPNALFNELSVTLMDDVVTLPITADDIAREWRAAPLEESKKGYMLIGSQKHHSGYRPNSLVRIENLLFDIAQSIGRKIWYRYGLQTNYSQIVLKTQRVFAPHDELCRVVLEIASTSGVQEGVEKGDLLVTCHETGARDTYFGTQGSMIDDYFQGLRLLLDLGADNVLLDFVEHHRNRSRLTERLIIAILLLICLILLACFLIVQVQTVISAL